MEKRVSGLKRAYAFVLAGVLLVIGASVAYAAIPAANGTISACYDKQSGQLRLYDATTNLPKGCGPKEVSVTWNAQGQPGQPGTDGADGVSGWERVTNVSATDSVYDKTEYAMCPTGKKAIGGGAGVYGPPVEGGDLIVFGVGLVQDHSFNGVGWAARATEFTPTDDEWYLYVEVICADV